MANRTIKIVTLILLITFINGCGTKRFDKLRTKKINLKPEVKARFLTFFMKKALTLDKEQVTMVNEINIKFAKETELILDKKLSDISTYLKLRKSNKSKEKELKGIFSKQQFKDYKIKKKEIIEQLKDFLQTMKERKEKKGSLLNRFLKKRAEVDNKHQAENP